MSVWTSGGRTEYLDSLHDGAPTLEFLKEGRHVARKPWTCSRCKKERPAGTTYVGQFGKSDGQVFNDKHCPGSDYMFECDYDQKWWLVTFERDPSRPIYDMDSRGVKTSFQRVIMSSREGNVRDYAEPMADGTPPHDYKIVSVVEITKEEADARNLEPSSGL